uniref:CSON008220 protein n=1 Tax=Culicoides sonorensis TaxID=179676 RepID=A0A336LNR6_CULSO
MAMAIANFAGGPGRRRSNHHHIAVFYLLLNHVLHSSQSYLTSPLFFLYYLNLYVLLYQYEEYLRKNVTHQEI